MSIFSPRSMVTILCFLFTFAIPQLHATENSQKQREHTYRNLELFSNILSILQENYVEEIDTEQVIEGAINGLLLSLDPHSSYLTPKNFEELQDETHGSFTGIGIEITIKEGKLTVVSPIEDTPAYNAGILVNDVIMKIGETWTKDLSPMEAIKKLRGPKGSSVTIAIEREGSDQLQEYTLVRDTIPVNSVRAFFVDRGIIYTRITNFQSHTTQDYLDSLKEHKKEQDIQAIILDLRNNPGGLLNQAVSLADLFLDEGLIVYTKGRTEDQNMVFKARKSSTRFSVPLIVLVNEGSASASEIVAGAIQDQGRGLLLGTKTFGKGSVQTIVPLQDGAGLRMTTARYFTPSGRSIQAKGITPDIEVEFETVNEHSELPEGTHYTREKDLSNHIENNGKDTPEKNNQSINDNENPPLLDEKVIARIKRDNQLRLALNIIKGVSLLKSTQLVQ